MLKRSYLHSELTMAYTNRTKARSMRILTEWLFGIRVSVLPRACVTRALRLSKAMELMAVANYYRFFHFGSLGACF